MKAKRILSGLLSAVVAISATVSMVSFTASADETFDDLNQEQITAAMGAGWNLGNQLEASNNKIPEETTYGNPVIKKELLQAVKKAGFKSVRIPISYLSKIGQQPTYKIDEAWLNRIKEVVDYAIDEDLYVIINMHGDGYNTVDGGWLLCNAADGAQTEIKKKYAACWTQIAEKFADYDEHLIFESMNEEFDGSYTTPNRKFYENINAYNQIFIDSVRQTGGNNAKRWLLTCGWNTDIDNTVGDYGFELPTDTHRSSSIPADEQRIMISVHYYDPWDFCGDGTSGNYSEWGSNANANKKVTWNSDEEYMEEQIKKVNEKFVSAGYPVVIGEYGCINKTSSDPVNNLYRAHYVKTMCELSKQYKCIPVYWDNGAISDSFGLINRKTYEVEQPEIIEAMMQVYLTPKENVDRYIAKASALVGDRYTKETWGKLETALTKANQLISDSASDEELLNAYEELTNAYYSLMPDESYLIDQVVATDENIANSDKIEAKDGLFLSVDPKVLSVVTSKKITIKFKVLSGTPESDTNLFVLKPYSNNTFDGWTDNFIKLSDCKYNEETGEYTAEADPQKILESYADSTLGHRDPNGANSINIYYCTKKTTINLQLTYCSFAFTVQHTRHYYVETDRTEKTELVDGHINYKCVACGDTYDNVLKATGHSWGQWTTVKEATCTAEGSEKRVCRICSEEETRAIRAKGHTFVNGVCTVCKAKDPNYVAPKTDSTVDKNKKAAEKAMKKATIKKLTVNSKAKKKITVSWKKVSKANGYQVQVAKKKNFKGKQIIFKKFTSKIKLSVKSPKIKSKKTYFVRVRAYAVYKNSKGKNIKVYGKFGKKLKVKVK